ncbi:MAG: ScpA family protein [Chloroflexi bacterium]|nr:ScpA family protein [Chloroflexota bacterium]
MVEPQSESGTTEHAVVAAGEAAAAGVAEVADVAEVAEVAAGDAFRLQLAVFEGPLDLLLHLIERDELDVTEVSLLAVTEQYMQHLRSTEQINLGALADFIGVGARLLLLKSRALLPRDEDAAGGDDADSEARELIDALREYRRYKEAALFLRERDGGHATYRRQATPPKVTLPTGLDTVTLDSLADLIREVLARLPEDEPPGEVRRDPVRLRDRMTSLVDTLERDGRTSFRRLIEGATSRVVVIVDFLAVLELIKSGYLEARQAEAFGDIDLVRREAATRPDVVTLAANAGLDPDSADAGGDPDAVGTDAEQSGAAAVDGTDGVASGGGDR